LTISYIGLTEASNGYHVVKIMEWLNVIRKADWVPWKTATNIHPYLARLLIRGMYPVIVKLPVSGSLFGKLSDVKQSAR
jgi:hypothetical protein